MLIDNIKSIVLSWRWSWVFIYFLLIVSFFILGCESPTAPPEDIPQGYAKITGTIINIPGTWQLNTTVANVRIESASYSTGFPTFNKNEIIRIKFYFEIKSYPSMYVGDRFTALVGLSKKCDSLEYFIYGWSGALEY